MMGAREVDTQTGYALWAASYDLQRNGLIEAEEPRIDALMETIGPVRSVLDVATGTGRYALRWARRGAQVVAFDASEEMLARARSKARDAALHLNFVRGTIDEGLPFPDGAFDLVICALVLCHLPDLSGVVRELGRVVRMGGHLLITDFHPESVARGWRTSFRIGEQGFDLPNMPHTRQQYLEAVRGAGCAVVWVEDIRVRDAPVDAWPERFDVEQLLRDHGDGGFGLIILGQRANNEKTESLRRI